MPFIYTYLVDGNGDYILDGSNNRIIVDSFEYQVTSFDWRRIASSVKKPPYIRSFQIRKFDGGATWLLIVNQKQLIGIYPSQDAALQVLTGLFTRVSASEEFAQSTMSYQLSLGSSTIDDAFNNITLEQSGDDLIITLSNINTTGLATATVEYDDYTTPGTPGALTLAGAVTEPEAGTQIFTVVNGYAGVPENSYIQAFFTDFGVSTESSSNVLIKDDVAPTGFSVKIGTISDEDAAPEATTDGVTYTGAAYAYPQWVSNDWPEGVTPSYSYAWTYTIDAQAPVAVGGSGSTLNLALVPYGATLTCGAVATAYVNGQIATSTDPATQVAVTVTQTSIEEVADIKLFLTADPNGTPVATPLANTTYYAYGFDATDTYIPYQDMTWLTSLVAVDYDSTWMDTAAAYEAFPSARWINADGEEASGTYKVGVFAKHIAGIAEVKIYARKHVGSFTVQDDPISGWDLVDTIITETTETYRGNSIAGYWADWTVPASAQTAADTYKFKAVITSRPYANYLSGSVRNLDGARYADQPLSGDGVYNDMGLLRRMGWGSYGLPYGIIAKKSLRVAVGDGNPFNGEYLHSVTVGRPYLGDLYVDFATGSDTTGTGAAGNPYQTVTQAMFSNETAETSYDYILVDGDHRLATDISFDKTRWQNSEAGIGGRTIYKSGSHLPIIKAATPGSARIVGLCDANRDPVLTTGGISTLYDTELQGIVFYADDELTGVWDGPQSSATFAVSGACVVMDGCREEERWDYSAAPFNNPDAHRPSTTMNLRPTLGVFSYNHTMQNVGNGQSATVAVNHTYDSIIEDAVASQLGIDFTVSRCDNSRVPGYYYDYALTGDLAWTEAAGTYSSSLANLTDYTNSPVSPGAQVWLGLSINAAGVLTLDVNSGEGATLIRDFSSFDITANGNTYTVKTTGSSNTPGTPDVITWDASHRQNAMLIALYADIVAEGTPAVDNFFRQGSPHPDFIQVYTAYTADDDLGNRVVDNYINSNCHAAGPNNSFQGLFFSDALEFNSCYFGDLTMNGNNNGTFLNAYGKNVSLINVYWFSSVTGCLLERINATGGTYRTDGTGVATNMVMRDCGWVTYSTTSPDHGQDDSATNGKSAIDSFPGRNAQGDDWWYGSANYPEEAGYPAPGFMFPDLDGPNNNTGTPNAYVLAGGPSLSPGWTATTSKTVRYEVTGSNGIPQQGPASAHWSASVTPLGWRVDPAFTGNLVVPGYSINVDVVPVAYSSPEPATVSWEWKLDGIATGNTTATYSIVEADEAKELTCVFTATDGTGSTDLVTISVIGTVAPLGGTSYQDYMTANAGVDHAVIPFATGITDNITLAGDGSSTWATFTTSVGVVYPLDTVSGETVTAPATNKRALYGPNSAQSNPYQYAAIGWREASGQFQGVASAGWIVLEREQTIGSFNPTFQAYFPVEGTDGINGVTPYDNGALPAYNNSGGTGSLDMVMFFFDGYAAGAVQAWDVWDGITLP